MHWSMQQSGMPVQQERFAFCESHTTEDVQQQCMDKPDRGSLASASWKEKLKVDARQTQEAHLVWHACVKEGGTRALARGH